MLEGDELGIHTQGDSTQKLELLDHRDKHRETERTLLACLRSIGSKTDKKLLSLKEWEKGLGYSSFL